QLTRPDYTGPIMAAQVIDGNPVPLPAEMPVSWDGFEDFFHIEVTKAGVTVAEIDVDFCPNSYDRQRVSDDGPLTPTYPEACFANPFTKGMVWGIDGDWGTSTVGYYGTYADLKNGAHKVTTSISEDYAELFDVAEDARSVTTDINVTTMKDPCHHGCGAPKAGYPAAVKNKAVPIMDNPAPSILPDLEALPAWGISVQNKKNGKSFVTFGATVWTSGAADMVVEGFRRPNAAIMDGFQYFHNGAGDVIGKSQVGTLEYDQRDGHNHWHFLQFAGYSLLTAEDATTGIRSTKEAFCLAPTDAIDLSLDGAAMNPQLGLSTACGSQNSRWIREILPLGWGDTYFQGLPGQSFNITNLPNGTYWIEVEANPGGHLHEQTDANNVELREIQLSGKYGKRKVVVPPWNGIDTD
ncbi:MAG: hypothetical protein GEU71_17350, partial [Actinobacteria bacterium]|nr:hypothetical protein [Actinomycetota bacterium]